MLLNHPETIRHPHPHPRFVPAAKEPAGQSPRLLALLLVTLSSASLSVYTPRWFVPPGQGGQSGQLGTLRRASSPLHPERREGEACLASQSWPSLAQPLAFLSGMAPRSPLPCGPKLEVPASHPCTQHLHPPAIWLLWSSPLGPAAGSPRSVQNL